MAIARPQPDYRIPRQLGFGDDPISNTSSRSTSRSRSPMPQTMLFAAVDTPATDEQTQLPNLFLATVQATIDIATEVLDTPISTFMARPGACQEYVQRMIDIRNVWQENPQWPGRDWYVLPRADAMRAKQWKVTSFAASLCRYGSMLFAISNLARALEWWAEEKVFWDFDDDENADPLTFVLRPPPRVKSPAMMLPPPSSFRRSATTLGIDLQSGVATPSSVVYPSVDEVLDGHRDDNAEAAGLLATSEVERKLSTGEGDLHTQVEQARMLNVVLELGLDGNKVGWVNPAWKKVVGLEVDDVIDKDFHKFLAPADSCVVSDASRALIDDVDGHIAHVRFRIQVSLPALIAG